MRKIEFWRTVGDTYLFLFGDLARFFVASGAWLVAIIVTATVADLLFFVSSVLAYLVLIIGWIALDFAGLFAFAVSWHRAILHGEPPRMALRFGRRERRFTGYSLLIVLIALGPMLVGGIVFFLIVRAPSAPSLVTFKFIGAILLVIIPALVASWGILARLSLALPAAAVDEPGGQLRQAWRRAEGNTIRLFCGPFLVALPIDILQRVMQYLLGPPVWQTARLRGAIHSRPTEGQLIVSLCYVVLYFVQTALAIGFLSFSYRQITGHEGPSQPA